MKISDVVIIIKETGEEFTGKMFGNQKTPNKKTAYEVASEPFFLVTDMGFSKEFKAGETLELVLETRTKIHENQ